MNYKKSLLLIFLIGIFISTIGFFIDTDVREPSLFTNLFEIGMMGIVISLLISLIYFPIRFLSLFFKK